jgi:hypothetical protein
MATPGALVASASPTSDQANEALCRKYFKHSVCSEALARWLPYLGANDGPSVMRAPTHIVDGFRTTVKTSARAFSAYAPIGTSFSHGNAGPPRGSVVYDRSRHIAFFGEGCCSYFSVVLAAHVAPPPVSVEQRDLGQVATDSGVRLGDTPAKVMRVFGAAPLQPIPGRSDMQTLRYENSTPPKPMCTQRDTFGFTHGRLTVVEIYDGC